MNIAVLDDTIDLGPTAARIRASSNFRFAWRFFSITGADLRTLGAVASAFRAIADREELHAFLRDTMDDMFPRPFVMERLHRHCSIEAAKGAFLDTMARAVNDRLGAYSRDTSASTADERKAIEAVFSRLGHLLAFTIRPGSQDGCDVCRDHNSHLFSSWFFGVAWDFTFFLTWPDSGILWMGCLSDTD